MKFVQENSDAAENPSGDTASSGKEKKQTQKKREGEGGSRSELYSITSEA